MHVKSCKGSHIVPRVRIGEKSEIKKLKTGEAKSKYVVCKVLKTSKEDLKPFLSKFLVQKVDDKVQSSRETTEVNNEVNNEVNSEVNKRLVNNEAADQSDEIEGNLDLDLECENLETAHGNCDRDKDYATFFSYLKSFFLTASFLLLHLVVAVYKI